MQQVHVQLERENPEEPTNLRHLSTVPYYKKVYMRSSDCVCHVLKVDPSKPFDKLKMSVEVVLPKGAEGYGSNLASGGNYQPMRNHQGVNADRQNLMLNIMSGNGGMVSGGDGNTMF